VSSTGDLPRFEHRCALVLERPPGNEGFAVEAAVREGAWLGEPVSLRVGSDALAAGRASGELDLRDTTGTTVLAIVRGDEHVMLLAGRERIKPGDVFALAGTPQAVRTATA